MASLFTTRMRYEKQANGENNTTWGDKVNEVFDLVDEARGGFLSKSVAGSSDVTLTALNSPSSDENRQAVIDCTGVLTGSINLIVQTAESWWMIKNSTTGAFTLTVKTAAGSGIVITQGEAAILYSDGTDVKKVMATDDVDPNAQVDVITTKGDVVVGSDAGAAARLVVGANTQVLTADSAVSGGVKWAASATGGDVNGPASSTDRALALYGDTSGDLIKDGPALGTSGHPLVSGGAGADPSFVQLGTVGIANNAVDGTKISLTSEANGTILYHNGSNWVILASGTSGQFLTSNGAAAPSWGSGAEFPAGTSMLFQQTTAPTGWTKQTTHNNKGIRLQTGTVTTGGTDAFTATFSSGKTTDGHALVIAEMPSHTHVQRGSPGSDSTASMDIITNGNNVINSVVSTASTGGGGSHTHPIAMDLQFVDFIIANKD